CGKSSPTRRAAACSDPTRSRALTVLSATSDRRRIADAHAALGVLTVRRNPIHDSLDDRFDDRDELPREVPQRVRRVSTTPVADRNARRGEVRHIRPTQRLAPRRGPDPRVWFTRGSSGVAALAGLWLGRPALVPLNASR